MAYLIVNPTKTRSSAAGATSGPQARESETLYVVLVAARLFRAFASITAIGAKTSSYEVTFRRFLFLFWLAVSHPCETRDSRFRTFANLSLAVVEISPDFFFLFFRLFTLCESHSHFFLLTRVYILDEFFGGVASRDRRLVLSTAQFSRKTWHEF